MKTFEQIYQLREDKKPFVGDCRDLEVSNNLPWEDTTECANDLGYWARMDEYDGSPEDSNYEKITKEEFWEACERHRNPQFDWERKAKDYTDDWDEYIDGDKIYLKRYDGNIYLIYDENEDVHYFWW